MEAEGQGEAKEIVLSRPTVSDIVYFEFLLGKFSVSEGNSFLFIADDKLICNDLPNDPSRIHENQ